MSLRTSPTGRRFGTRLPPTPSTKSSHSSECERSGSPKESSPPFSSVMLVSTGGPTGTPSARPYDKVEPQFELRTFRLAEGIFAALFIGHVGEHGAAQLPFFQPDAELSQVARECIHVRVIILGVFTQIVASQLARRPGFVKRMTEQVILMNAFFEQRQKCLNFHDYLGTLPLYGLGRQENKEGVYMRCSAQMKAVSSITYNWFLRICRLWELFSGLRHSSLSKRLQE